jgi:transketolase
MGRRFEAYGWHTLVIENGNDLEAITSALKSARIEQKRPSLILKQDTFAAHDTPSASGTPGLNNNAYTNFMTVWVLCRVHFSPWRCGS